MVFKKLLNGLPVLGLLALLACPTTDTEVQGDGPTVSKDPAVNANKADITKLQEAMKKMLTLEEVQKAVVAGVIIDPTKPDAALKKVFDIMKNANPSPCNPLYPPNLTAPGTPVKKVGSHGGTFEYGIFSDKSGATDKASDKKTTEIATAEFIGFEYKDYSIDGLYKLTGKFVFATAKLEVDANDGAYLKAGAKKGYLLTGGSEDTTLTLDAVDGPNKKFSGFTDTKKDVKVVFPTAFGMVIVDADGKKCAVPGAGSDAFKIDGKAIAGPVKTLFEDVFGKVSTDPAAST